MAIQSGVCGEHLGSRNSCAWSQLLETQLAIFHAGFEQTERNESPNFQCGRLSGVTDVNVQLWLPTRDHIADFHFPKPDVGTEGQFGLSLGKLVLPLHSFGGEAGIFNGLASENDLLVKKDGADRRNQSGGKRRDNHPKRPESAGLLGGKIAYLVVLACGGMGICYCPFNRAGKARNIWQTFGWASIVAVAGLIASYRLILLMAGSV